MKRGTGFGPPKGSFTLPSLPNLTSVSASLNHAAHHHGVDTPSKLFLAPPRKPPQLTIAGVAVYLRDDKIHFLGGQNTGDANNLPGHRRVPSIRGESFCQNEQCLFSAFVPKLRSYRPNFFILPPFCFLWTH